MAANPLVYGRHHGVPPALIRRKEIKPLELVEAAIERVETVNPDLNLVITTLFDEARKAAKEKIPDGPFAGRFGDEATLFRLAAQLEEARPWAIRKPPVCA